MLKKFLSISLLSVILMSAVVNVDARGAWCYSCNNGELNYAYTRTVNTTTSEQKCQHGYPYGTDKVYTTHYVDVYICNNCGNSTTRSYSNVTSIECHGYH